MVMRNFNAFEHPIIRGFWVSQTSLKSKFFSGTSSYYTLKGHAKAIKNKGKEEYVFLALFPPDSNSFQYSFPFFPPLTSLSHTSGGDLVQICDCLPAMGQTEFGPHITLQYFFHQMFLGVKVLQELCCCILYGCCYVRQSLR